MNPHLNLTEQNRLKLWDNIRFDSFLPCTVYLFVSLTVGVPGNIIVLYVYGFRLRGRHNGRYFIPYLAVADLLALILSVALHAMSNFFPVTFKYNELCSWSFTLAFLTTILSAFILLIISVQRYLKVCKPFGGQMTLFWRRMSLLLSLILSIGLAIPSYFTFGSENVYNEELNVTGSACRRLTSTTQTASLIHSVICALFMLAEAIALTILYAEIAKVIFRRKKEPLSTFYQANSKENDKKKNNNVSLMFMIITIIFIISFITRLVTFILESAIVGIWERLSVTEYGVVRMIELFYIINHLANPFIYAFMDDKFISELKIGLFCKTKLETDTPENT
ncbi:neuromedin-U receptor 2-like [Saccostrea echinata]|uniref:neuromedin-U receptor 2-like n=1 Tax=Saccostrea echinata TaxID=191078 RepID=UPI002A835C63|nr:neuromedin-U receptor 2-like [Saccostrea echinata]